MNYIILFMFACPIFAEEWKGRRFPSDPSKSEDDKTNEIDYNAPVKEKNILEDSWGGKWFPDDPRNPKTHTNTLNNSWEGKWFPEDPTNQKIHTSTLNNSWEGKWFPEDPRNPKIHTSTLNNSWEGKWFPEDPTNKDTHTSSVIKQNERIPMGPGNPDCDDGKTNLKTDFDPSDPVQSDIYMCLEDRSKFRYNFSVEPILSEHTIPPAYSALHYCMDDIIEYEERLPTFGTHRPVWLQYGEYTYAPPQRWIHNLEHGAIVMLYHPCADYNEIEKLKMLVKNCLFRHVITSSNRLLPERPLALVAWGKSLEMSVIDTKIVVEFIKANALKGAEKTYKDGQYVQLLTQAAKVVSDEADSILCPNNSF